MEQLIEDYKRRLNTLSQMILDSDNSLQTEVLRVKASCYRTFIYEMERLGGRLKAKDRHGRQFEVAGYQPLDSDLIQKDKPKEGFVYVLLPDGRTGTYPDDDILNWDQLSSLSYLHPFLRERNKEILNSKGLI